MATTIRIEPALEARYKKLAKETGRSQTFYISRALSESIDKLEWEYGILKDAEEIRAGKQETTPLEDVMAEYGL